jgi:hypothetical protein
MDQVGPGKIGSGVAPAVSVRRKNSLKKYGSAKRAVEHLDNITTYRPESLASIARFDAYLVN